MEELEDVTGTRKISSLSLLPNLNSDRHNKNYYDTNQYSQNDGRKINSIELSRQSSMTRHSSSSNNRICCSNVYCSPEWRRISRKSIIISVFLFFGGLAIFLSGLVIYFRSMQSKGSEFLILGSIMLLPGTYGMSVIFGILQGWQGYHPDLIGESRDGDEEAIV